MKTLRYATFLTLLSPISVSAQDIPHPGFYTGTIAYTQTSFDAQKPIRNTGAIRLGMNSETTMSLEIEGLFDGQLLQKSRQYHAVGSAYQPFLGELFFITLPMHFDKTGEKMAGSFIMTRVSPGNSVVYEGKFKATKEP